MSSQELSTLQKEATYWWSNLLDPEKRIELAVKYIGTRELKTLSHLEIMYCFLYQLEG